MATANRILARWLAGVLTALAFAGLALPSPGAQTRVYLTEEDAIRAGLGDARDVRERRVEITPELARTLSDDAGAAMVDSVYVFHEAWGDSLERSVVVVNAMGQYQPITFAVTIAAHGEVERVEIMVYRESRGGEVRRRAFLRQFKAKAAGDVLIPGDDIMAISGATISSRGVADGVRLAIRLHEAIRSAANHWQ